MINLSKIIFFLIVFFLATPSLKATTDLPDYSIEIGPYVGAGTASSGADVRSSSGLKASLQKKLWPSYSGFSAAPRIEIGDGIFNTKAEKDNHQILSTYDTTFLMGGFVFSKALNSKKSFFDEVYLTALGGWAQSSLQENESFADNYAQKSYSNINGPCYSSELGTQIKLKEKAFLNMGIFGQYYNANQSNAKGTITADRVTGNGRLSLSSQDTGEFTDLDNHVSQTTIAAALSLLVNF